MREHDWQEITGPTGWRSLRCAACEVMVNGWERPADAKPCPGPLVVNIRVVGDWSLRVGQIWPDGDYPAEITAEAVAEVMRQYGSTAIHDEWDLRGDVYVDVAGDHTKVF